jgi:SAM-dependent methyltransferase
MVAHARETLGDRATVIHADLTELELERPVDAVFSNAVFHWVHDLERLFTRLYTALRPGGIMVAGFGASGNLEQLLGVAAEVAGEAPFARHLSSYEPGWRFRGTEETKAGLLAAGFVDVRVEVDSVTEAPLDPAGYLRTAPLLCHLELLPEELHDPFVDEVIRRCPAPMRIDHIRLKIEARRPGD